MARMEDGALDPTQCAGGLAVLFAADFACTPAAEASWHELRNEGLRLAQVAATPISGEAMEDRWGEGTAHSRQCKSERGAAETAERAAGSGREREESLQAVPSPAAPVPRQAPVGHRAPCLPFRCPSKCRAQRYLQMLLVLIALGAVSVAAEVCTRLVGFWPQRRLQTIMVGPAARPTTACGCVHAQPSLPGQQPQRQGQNSARRPPPLPPARRSSCEGSLAPRQDLAAASAQVCITASHWPMLCTTAPSERHAGPAQSQRARQETLVATEQRGGLLRCARTCAGLPLDTLLAVLGAEAVEPPAFPPPATGLDAKALTAELEGLLDKAGDMLGCFHIVGGWAGTP